MIRFGPEDRAIDRAIDRHGIHEVGGPLLVGGVNLLNTRTGLFYDQEVRHILTDEHRFRAYLEFREQAFKIAVAELMYGAKSPNEKFLCQQLSSTQRYFAFRKFLVKLDFIQSNSDPESVIKRLKSSTICRVLPHHELRRCLEGHMDFLKEYEDKKMDPASSISEYESIAVKKINSELSSALQKHLDRYDWMLMEQYYDRMKLRRLARECATQAQMTEHVLVAEGLPIKAHLKKHMLSANPEVKKLPWIKQAAKRSFDGYIGRIQERFRSRAPLGRPFQLLFAGTLATIAMGIGSKR